MRAVAGILITAIAISGLSARAQTMVEPTYLRDIGSLTAQARSLAKQQNDLIAKSSWHIDPLETPETFDKSKPPIEVFVGRSSIELMAMSPNGKRIAAIRRIQGDTKLMVLDAENPAVGGKITSLGASSVRMLTWANNDRILYVMRADKPVYKADNKGIYMEGAPRLYGINADLSAPLMFFANDAKMARGNASLAGFVRLPGDPNHLLIPAAQNDQLDLLKVDVRTGAYEKVADGDSDTRDWYADRQGVPGIRVDSNARGTELYYYVRTSAPGQPLVWREVMRFARDPETNYQKFQAIAAAPKPGQFYVVARPDGEDTLGVYIYDIANGQYVQKLFSKPGFDVSGVQLDDRTGDYLGAYYWDDRLRFEATDAGAGELMTAVDGYFEKKQNVMLLDYAADVGRALVKARSPTNAGEYHIVDLKAGTVNALGKVKPELAGLALGTTQAVRYSARDGASILAYLTLPAGFKPSGPKPPLVVMVHGGPEARDTSDYDDFVQFLASRGYMILQPQFRGSAGFGDAFARAGHGKWGAEMQTDIVDGVEFLASKGVADKARTCIFGGSYGGYAALMGAAQYSSLYKCAISAFGVSDLNRMLTWEANEDGGASDSVKYWNSQMGSTEVRNAASPIRMVDKISIPVLLMHGDKDRTVPIVQSQAMRDALKGAGKEVEYMEFEYLGHGYWGRNGKAFMVAVERFLGKHLGMTPVPPLPDPAEPKS